MNGSETFLTSRGGEWVGVTFTLDEKVGSKLLAIIKASKRLKRSDHLLSSSVILASVLGLCDLEAFAEGDLSFLLSLLSFLGFLSGEGTEAGDLTEPWSSTAPIIDTLEGSTSSSESWEGVVSLIFASRFSFFNL